MTQKLPPQLSYYFDSQRSFFYEKPSTLLSGNTLPITMPNNNSGKSTMSLKINGVNSYYTLNSFYISLNMNKNITASYQLILQGNKNDYANDNIRQILVIIPIFNDVYNTIQKTNDSIIKINNLYITSIFNHARVEETYNFTYGNGTDIDNIDKIDINQLLAGADSGKFYKNIIDTTTNINYNIIQFEKSNLWYPSTEKPPSIFSALIKSPFIGTTTSESINVKNNLNEIKPITETDIYIDCSPTNNIGEAVDVYTSKDLDQLKLFKINDLKIWAFRFITIIVIVLIIFLIIKIFQISEPSKPNPQVQVQPQPGST